MSDIHRPPMRLGRRHEWLVYLVCCLLALSGVGWLISHYFFAVKSEFGGAVSPFEPFWLAFHGAAAMAALIIIGSVLPGHVSRAWKLKKNHRSGIAVLAVAALLIGTGYGLYYLGDENTRPIISLVHWVMGLLSTAVLLTHVLLGKKSQRPRVPNGRSRSGAATTAQRAMRVDDDLQGLSKHESPGDLISSSECVGLEVPERGAAARNIEAKMGEMPHLLAAFFLLAFNILFWWGVVQLVQRMTMIGAIHIS